MLIDEFIIQTKDKVITEKILWPQNSHLIGVDETIRYDIKNNHFSYTITLESIYNKYLSLAKYTIQSTEELQLKYQLSDEINFIFQWDSIKSNGDLISIDNFISGDIDISNGKQEYSTFKISKNHTIMLVVLSIDKNFFLDIFKDDFYIKHFPLFQNANNSTNYRLEQKNKLKISIPIKNIIEKCYHNPFDDKLEAYYIFSKIHGLISLIHEMQIERKVETLTEDVISKLNEARLILADNLTTPPTIKSLSKMVALNELKLKQGFKELFGSTIHNYSIKLRMEKAQSLMNDNNLLIFEVAIMLGYKDTSHFINVFKKYFGYTPKFFCTKIKAT